MAAQYAVGIDLGTTNSVISYIPLDAEIPKAQLVLVPQQVAASTLEEMTGLPSFLYLAPEIEASANAETLPWNHESARFAGEWARRRSAEVPDRTVGAAKSWLCYSEVDRTESILPWNAPEEVGKVSPVTASAEYLLHLVHAWNVSFPEAPLDQQQVTLTVPASFDASARDLTREAAVNAGLPADLILLEEPQAALYAWLEEQGDAWRKHLEVGDRILVCDVGGGTTDLTLIQVDQQDGDLELSREAVGRHLLVGGDNMDLALAYHAANEFQSKGLELDPWQSVSLWHSCRAAKETLLGDTPPDEFTLTVKKRSSKLVGGTEAIQISGQFAANLLLDGFFPHCNLLDSPQSAVASGFQELGLPYEADTAITRHVAAFLNRQSAPENGDRMPTHVLFNGGVFKADRLRTRMLETLASWNDGKPIEELQGDRDLDHAVSRGAAFYGWAKNRGGVRIRGGTARSYYIGIESAGLAIPGAPRPLHALCVVPFGMEEGTDVNISSREMGLIVGQPARFRFFSSVDRQADEPGTMVQRWAAGELVETDSLETTLSSDSLTEDSFLPVRFHTKITELGMLELWCRSTKTEDEWKLEFNVREPGSS